MNTSSNFLIRAAEVVTGKHFVSPEVAEALRPISHDYIEAFPPLTEAQEGGIDEN